MTNQQQVDEMVVHLGRTTDRSGVREARIPEWVLRRCRAEAWLYGELSLLADDDVVSVPLQQLAGTAGVSTRTMQKTIAVLREAGAVSVQPRHSDNGGRLPNRYVLHYAPPGGEDR